MKLYVDSTVLTAYYLPDSASTEAEAMLRGWPQPAVSPLAEVELAAVLARRVADGGLTPEAMGRVLDLFDDQLAAGYFDRVALDARGFERARRWIERAAGPPTGVPLTAVEALHLAAAGAAARRLLTGNRRLAAAAAAVGVPVVTLGSEPAPGAMVHEPPPVYDAGFPAGSP